MPAAQSRIPLVGESALHIACMGDTLRVRQLLAQGYDANAVAALPNGDVLTPLMVAVEGHADIVALLLKHGASVAAIYPPDDEGARSPLLVYAARFKRPEIVALLLKAGAGIDAIDSVGRTAINVAACVGDEELLVRLISAGANVEITDDGGRNALGAASHNGHEKCVHILIQAGADVLKVDGMGFSALHWAAWSGMVSSIKALLSRGALVDIDKRNSFGYTALTGATVKKRANAVKALIDAGADHRHTQADGSSWIWLADDLPIFKILLEAHRDVATEVDRNGDTFFHKAVDKKLSLSTPFICAIFKAGVNPALRNKYGVSPADSARRMGQIDTAKLLDVLATKYVDNERSGALESAAQDFMKVFEEAKQSSESENVDTIGKVYVDDNVEDAVKAKHSSENEDVGALDSALNGLNIKDEETKQDTDAHKNAHTCMHCKAATNKRCARCKTAYICSRACQLATWAEHKTTCMKIHKEREASIKNA